MIIQLYNLLSNYTNIYFVHIFDKQFNMSIMFSIKKVKKIDLYIK